MKQRWRVVLTCLGDTPGPDASSSFSLPPLLPSALFFLLSCESTYYISTFMLEVVIFMLDLALMITFCIIMLCNFLFNSIIYLYIVFISSFFFIVFYLSIKLIHLLGLFICNILIYLFIMYINLFVHYFRCTKVYFSH